MGKVYFVLNLVHAWACRTLYNLSRVLFMKCFETQIYLYACSFVYIHLPPKFTFTWGSRSEMPSHANNEDSYLLSPRKSLEEEYLAYETKVKKDSGLYPVFDSHNAVSYFSRRLND